MLDSDRNHIHDNNNTVELSHAICTERSSEQLVQKEFDSADPNSVRWNINAVEGRHEICHESPPTPKRIIQPNQLSLTLLRSCRQIYLEANIVPYTKNTFAINCNLVLERFAKARLRNKQHLAIRSLYLDVIITHGRSIDAWSNSMDKAILKCLRSVRCLYLNLVQAYCACSIEIFGYEGFETAIRQKKMFERLGKLPLKEATLVIDDSSFWTTFNYHLHRLDYEGMEQEYRWTLEQKQNFSKNVRYTLLERGEEKKGR